MLKTKPRLKVKRGTHGLGLFTLDEIKKGQFVIEYKGKIISDAEADLKQGKYLFEINKTWTLDGSGRDNIARYINHSCRPNCEVDVKPIKQKVYINARRRILPGEELNYDYGKEYFDGFIKPIGCQCVKCAEKKRSKKKKFRK